MFVSVSFPPFSAVCHSACPAFGLPSSVRFLQVVDTLDGYSPCMLHFSSTPAAGSLHHPLWPLVMAAPLCSEYLSLQTLSRSSTDFSSTTKLAGVCGFPDMYWNSDLSLRPTLPWSLGLLLQGIACPPVWPTTNLYPCLIWSVLKPPAESIVNFSDLIKPKNTRVAASQNIKASNPAGSTLQLVPTLPLSLVSCISALLPALTLASAHCKLLAQTLPLYPDMGHPYLPLLAAVLLLPDMLLCCYASATPLPRIPQNKTSPFFTTGRDCQLFFLQNPKTSFYACVMLKMLLPSGKVSPPIDLVWITPCLPLPGYHLLLPYICSPPAFW